MDVCVIQALFGHVRLDTAAFYTKGATRTMRAVTSPLDRPAARHASTRVAAPRRMVRVWTTSAVYLGSFTVALQHFRHQRQGGL